MKIWNRFNLVIIDLIFLDRLKNQLISPRNEAIFLSIRPTFSSKQVENVNSIIYSLMWRGVRINYSVTRLINPVDRFRKPFLFFLSRWSVSSNRPSFPSVPCSINKMWNRWKIFTPIKRDIVFHLGNRYLRTVFERYLLSKDLDLIEFSRLRSFISRYIYIE